MCISGSVGREAKNNKDDVKTIQILLNLNIQQLMPLGLLQEDGAIGKNTIAAIDEFQRRVLKMVKPDGRVDPGGKTLQKLKAGMLPGFSKAKLQGIMINATSKNIERYYDALNQKMSANGIDTSLRQVHFLAQIAHESGELRYSEEIASGEAYEGRKDLGNTEKGDGKRFKGRGLIQLTGRANYKAYGEARGIDYTLEKNAKLLSTSPNVAVDVACWFWVKKKLNDLADKDDVLAVTRRINGGTNGLADRKRLLERAKFFLMR